MSNVTEAHQPAVRSPIKAESDALRTRRRWTVEEYHRMGEMEFLGEQERVELIEGDIVEMSPIGSPHAGKLNRLLLLLLQHPNLVGKAIVAPQNPVVLDEHNEPQPDIAVLRWRDDCYELTHPGPEDVLLVIEISDSTIRGDRQLKAALYAHHGIPEYWLVNIPARSLEVYREPEEGQYRQVTEHRTGTLPLVALSDVVIDVEALFPILQSKPESPSAPA